MFKKESEGAARTKGGGLLLIDKRKSVGYTNSNWLNKHRKVYICKGSFIIEYHNIPLI